MSLLFVKKTLKCINRDNKTMIFFKNLLKHIKKLYIEKNNAASQNTCPPPSSVVPRVVCFLRLYMIRLDPVSDVTVSGGSCVFCD